MSLQDDANNEIAEALGRIGKAIETKDENEAMAAITILVGGALIDLRTIANAVSKLSTFEVEKVGEILRVGPVFSAEEIETIEALRRGDIVVTDAPLKYAGVDPDDGAMRMYYAEAKSIRYPLGSGPTSWTDLPDNDKDIWRKREAGANAYYIANSGSPVAWLMLTEDERYHWRLEYKKSLTA